MAWKTWVDLSCFVLEEYYNLYWNFLLRELLEKSCWSSNTTRQWRNTVSIYIYIYFIYISYTEWNIYFYDLKYLYCSRHFSINCMHNGGIIRVRKIKCPVLYILYMYISLHISYSWNGFNQLYRVCVISGWIKSVFFGWHRFYLVYRYICHLWPIPFSRIFFLLLFSL